MSNFSSAASGRLSGKRMIITGAVRGIGRAVAERCVAEGGRVVVIDLDCDAAAGAALEIGAEAGIAADVADAGAVASAVSDANDRLAGLDAVVNNAGIPMAGATHQLDEDDWDRVLAVDLKSVYLMSRAAWPHLRDGGAGAIVNTGSIAGMWGTEGQAGYAVAKAATIMLTKCLALDGARDGIRANSVSPGFVRTPMLEAYLAAQPQPAAAEAAISGRAPLGRLGRPTDLADAFVYLLSDEASWVTGANLVVDGGLTAGIWA
jgi:NAD(P)-dependent dehydrogenase (short-subunit alcohol dehydrogenase family)